MTKTPLYGLNKPGYDEAADIEVLNENADIVDSALGELSAGMGDSSTLLTEEKTLTGAVNELFIGVGDGKNAVAASITDMGQAAAGSDTFSDLSTKIRAISSDADAGTSNVLSGKTFYQGGSKKVGTMPNQVGKIIVPGTTNQPIDAGYHDGSGYVEGDADLIPANIKTGVNIFGVTGSYEGAGGEYGTATPSEVLEGYTLGTESGIVPGTMPNQGATNHSLPVNGLYTIPAGYHNGSGKVTQSIATKGAQTYTPGTVNQTIAAGQYLTGIQTIKGDANLVAGNIKSGVSIFGVAGNLEASSPHGVQVYTTPGTYTFTVPQGVNQIMFIATGGGGSGAAITSYDYPGGGGSGGHYIDAMSVASGQQIPVAVGAGGAGVYAVSGGALGNPGGSSSVGSCVAGGGGGAGADTEYGRFIGAGAYGGQGGGYGGKGQAGTGGNTSNKTIGLGGFSSMGGVGNGSNGKLGSGSSNPGNNGRVVIWW